MNCLADCLHPVNVLQTPKSSSCSLNHIIRIVQAGVLIKKYNSLENARVIISLCERVYIISAIHCSVIAMAVRDTSHEVIIIYIYLYICIIL